MALNGKGEPVFGHAALGDAPVTGLKNLLRDHMGRKAPTVELEGAEGPVTWLLQDLLDPFFRLD